MSRTLRDVALDRTDKNQPFASAVESEVTLQYRLLAFFAEMYMDQQRAKNIDRKHELLQWLESNPDDHSAKEELAELALELEEPVYRPMKTFGRRAEAIERAKAHLSQFRVVGSQRPPETTE